MWWKPSPCTCLLLGPTLATTPFLYHPTRLIIGEPIRWNFSKWIQCTKIKRLCWSRGEETRPLEALNVPLCYKTSTSKQARMSTSVTRTNKRLFSRAPIWAEQLSLPESSTTRSSIKKIKKSKYSGTSFLKSSRTSRLKVLLDSHPSKIPNRHKWASISSCNRCYRHSMRRTGRSEIWRGRSRLHHRSRVQATWAPA